MDASERPIRHDIQSAAVDPSSHSQPESRSQPTLHLRRPMLIQSEYVWFVFFSALDVLLTWAIFAADGTEMNPIAALVIDLWDLPGAIVFKFGLTLFVIIACEIIAGHRYRTALRLARLAVVVSAFPVCYSLMLLWYHVHVQL